MESTTIVAQRRAGGRIRTLSPLNDNRTCFYQRRIVQGILVRQFLVRVRTLSPLRFVSSTTGNFLISCNVRRYSVRYGPRTSECLPSIPGARRRIRFVRYCLRNIRRRQRCLVCKHLYCSPRLHGLRWRRFQGLVTLSFGAALTWRAAECGMNPCEAVIGAISHRRGFVRNEGEQIFQSLYASLERGSLNCFA